MRLDIGCGTAPVPGFQSWDRRDGREAYPLAVADGACDEIRASHVLEHFSHRQIAEVLADWARALKPGGLLRIAVPDFETISRAYLAGHQVPVEDYVMGSHTDANDHHGALFDFETLYDLLTNAGLVGITRWQSEQPDCAALPISLNLQAWKPLPIGKVAAVMSMPRLGFSDNFFTAYQGLQPLGIQLTKTTGAFWGQCLERAIEEICAKHQPDWILTLDYDTVFHRQDVMALYSALHRHPEVDALAPIQMGRKNGMPLFTIAGPDGHGIPNIEREALADEVVPVTTAHFGLTFLKASKLLELPHPWYWSKPDADGRWGDGRQDDDIYFWRHWAAAGNSVCLAPRVPVGHLELMVMWPDRSLAATYQHPSEWSEKGKPENVWR